MVGRSARNSLEKEKSFRFNLGTNRSKKESHLPNIHGGMQDTHIQFMQKQPISNSPKNN